LGKYKKVVVSFKREREFVETLTTVPGFIQEITLDHSPHGAIENQNPF
jgi:hypothetical protein